MISSTEHMDWAQLSLKLWTQQSNTEQTVHRAELTCAEQT